MSIKIGNYMFDGPYKDPSYLRDQAGVYAILCEKDSNKYSVVDIGESESVKTRVENHDRQSCWTKNCKSTLAVAVYYTSNGRFDIEQMMRAQFNPSCGDR